ncbi:MAG TPA: phage holin family protein [Gammaproteobacteria bacterium]|nr:phage holin family protein [Gammaproteobacteria bacterium]
MSELPDSVPIEHQQGILASVKTLGVTLIAVVHTRLEILATEVEEEKMRLARITLLAILAGFFLGMALLFLSILAVTLFWNDHRIAALGSVTVFYVLLGISSLFWFRSRMRRKSKLFAISLEELRKDYTELQT